MQVAPRSWSTERRPHSVAFHLHRLGLHPGAAWGLSWVLLFCGGMILNAEPASPLLATSGYLLGSLFPMLTLVGARGFAGLRVPIWLLPAAMGVGLLRGVLAALDAPTLGHAVALGYDLPLELFAAVVVFRAPLVRRAPLTRGLLGSTLVALACLDGLDAVLSAGGVDRAPLQLAWYVVAPVTAVLEVWAMWYWIAQREVRVERAENGERLLERELSEHLRVEKSLREKEAHLFELYERAPDLLLSVDGETGTILECTRKFSETLGYARRELIGRPLADLVDVSLVPRLREALKQTTEGGGLRDHELRLQRRSGGFIDVLANASLFSQPSGHRQELHLILRNVTRLRRLGLEPPSGGVLYRLLATHSPVGIFYADAEGRCLFVNQRFCQLTGLSPHEARNHGWMARVHPADRERVVAEWKDAVSKQVAFRCHQRVRSADGHPSHVLVESVALPGSGDEPMGCVGTVTLLGRVEEGADELSW